VIPARSAIPVFPTPQAPPSTPALQMIIPATATGPAWAAAVASFAAMAATSPSPSPVRTSADTATAGTEAQMYKASGRRRSADINTVSSAVLLDSLSVPRPSDAAATRPLPADGAFVQLAVGAASPPPSPSPQVVSSRYKLIASPAPHTSPEDFAAEMAMAAVPTVSRSPLMQRSPVAATHLLVGSVVEVSADDKDEYHLQYDNEPGSPLKEIPARTTPQEVSSSSGLSNNTEHAIYTWLDAHESNIDSSEDEDTNTLSRRGKSRTITITSPTSTTKMRKRREE
jgi:hypothetical protein